MDIKLTLKLNKDVIERAKVHARRNSTSLSKLIEAYLDMITGEEESKSTISPSVKRISGIIPKQSESVIKRSKAEYLKKKYS